MLVVSASVSAAVRACVPRATDTRHAHPVIPPLACARPQRPSTARFGVTVQYGRLSPACSGMRLAGGGCVLRLRGSLRAWLSISGRWPVPPPPLLPWPLPLGPAVTWAAAFFGGWGCGSGRFLGR